MNKKTLLIKILKFIYKANIEYKKSNTGDTWVLLFITFMSVFGIPGMLVAILTVLCLRAIFELDILEKIGGINEEEDKKDDA